MKDRASSRQFARSNRGHNHVSYDFESPCGYLFKINFFIFKVKIIVFVMWSYSLSDYVDY